MLPSKPPAQQQKGVGETTSGGVTSSATLERAASGATASTSAAAAAAAAAALPLPLPPLRVSTTPHASPVKASASAAEKGVGGADAADAAEPLGSAAAIKAALAGVVDKPSLYLVRAAQATT